MQNIKRAAIYIRTQSSKNCDCLIKNSQISEEIARLTGFAGEKGYTVVRVYVDNGYYGTNTSSPAHAVMYRDRLSENFDAVVIAGEHTVEEEGLHIALPLMTEAFGTVLLADSDEDAEEYILSHGRAWMLEALEQSRKETDDGKYYTLEEVDECHKAHTEQFQRELDADMAAAYEVAEPSAFGENVIEAQAALWLLKNGYKDDLLTESISRKKDEEYSN